MEREERSEDERTREAVAKYLDEYLALGSNATIPETTRRALRDDLLRAPILDNLVDRVEVRGQSYSQNFLLQGSPLRTIVMTVRRGEMDSVDLGGVTYYPRSYAGLLYALLLRQVVMVTGGWSADLIHRLADPNIWARDDVSAMHESYVDFLVFTRPTGKYSPFREAGVVVSRILYDPTHPQYRPELLRQLKRLDLDWMDELGLSPLKYDPIEDESRSLPDVAAIVRLLLGRLENRIQEEEQRRFGEGSRAAREVVDNLEYDQGQLSEECSRWTYEELEHWSRWSILQPTLPRLCGVVTTEVELMAFVGTIEFDVPCAELPPEERDTLLDIVRRVIRRATKRRLCGLLANYGSIPAVERWLSRRVDNVEVLSSYVPAEVLSLLLVEEVDVETYAFGRGLYDLILTHPEDKEVTTPILGSQRFVAYLASDLHTKLFAPRLDTEIHFNIERYDLSSSDSRVILSAQNHTEGEYKWCAVVVLKGRLAISLVTTNQITDIDREGEFVVERQEVGTVLEPRRIELRAGDVLVAVMSARAVVDGATTPFDTDAFYDCLVLRPQDENTVWLEYGF